ncbi:Outer membrane receptor proteins, mostly Fe transport [Lishizhenia tianjinensis]|uniref:Outer membrane receptor proteins, mostly Fe transport n=1 Tax=Lishizhenia tianjinensis TaxID=477690 RepID=A0A1I7BF53_9FLAO|nr:TonB-dependent receptor [Lishizhenia tianjinensis]SFT85742.1 Outer membrane receptor proteins, mostly Fe transport [Lishizhenia tianjinensis]
MRIFLLTILFALCANISQAQITQNVRGTVVDNETKYPLIGAKVQIFTKDSTQLFRALVDENGSFIIKNVPIGKHRLVATYISYETRTIPVTVNSGKESVVNLEMSEEVFETEEVQIVAQRKGEVLNEMATVSARQFSVEETDRYPGSRSDPARMASNFAGVQGADDSRNDIVVRGNSPLGLLYKVEGIDIPNPSHFSTSGSTGGPVSIINNKILGNSDFFMSAFPAEYGNSTSGVFDLKLRNGNQSVHEFTGQFGFLGTEVMAEGPINKDKRSSYIVMGRYSTLSIFQSLGIRIGTDAVPVYGDGAFKLNYPLKKGGALSVWGMGGKSEIAIKISEQTELTDEVYGEGDRDQYFGTSMGVVGLSYKKPVSTNTFLTATLALSADEQHSRHYLLDRSLDTNIVDGQQKISIRTDSIYQLMGYQFYNTKLSGYFSLNHKINKKHIIKAGINIDGIYTNNLDSVLTESGDAFRLRYDYAQAYTLIQPFVQYKWKVNPKMDLTAGLHNQYFSLSNSLSILEPRLGWKYTLKKDQVLTAGAGLHSQTQPLYLYGYQQYDSEGNAVLHNKNMDFTKSIHTAVGYERSFKKGFNVKAEAYYQHLYNVPVEIQSSALSLINMGSGFQRFFPDSLQNTGTGRNYGIELTVQKFFSKSFFFLVTGSLYDSKYKGSDGIERNTDYNGRYTVNVLGGKEFTFKGNQSISLGLKCTTAGGKRYGYVDVAASQEAQELVFLSEGYNERQFKDYFRLDVKVNYKLNTEKITHEIGLDLVNVLNTRNLLGLAYAPNIGDPTAEPIAERTQLGFLPIFYYRIDFKIKK